MAKTQTIPDETIIAALISSNSIKAAAEKLNITPRTIYERMRTREFQILYRDQKSSILNDAAQKLTEKISTAVDTIEEIMTSPEINATTRLQAAKMVFEMVESLNDMRRNTETSIADLQIDPLDPWEKRYI